MKQNYRKPRTEEVQLHGVSIMIPDLTPTSAGDVTPPNPVSFSWP